MAKFPEMSKKSWLASILALILTGFGFGQLVPLAPTIVDVGCAGVEAAGGGDCEA